MGLLRTLLTLPVSGPVNGALWLAGKVHEAALAQMNDPAAVKAALLDLERRLDVGEIDEDAFEEAEAALLDRLIEIQRAAASGR
jgi:hypothetical protein